MGIQGLTKVLSDHAPNCIKEHEIKNYFGRKVAIDASMSIYQFLIAVRQQDGSQLQDESGATTSHLMGIFYRTIRMVENGIKPCYVFDGKPPSMKGGELAKRAEKREVAEKELAKAEETGDTENFDKFSRRTVKVTKEHNKECQRLLGLMGMPYVVAPGEAEAQCALLAKAGKVFAAGSEDMDTLTFGSPVLLRHLTFSEARKAPILEVNLEKALEGLAMTMDQFIDLCILLGCDYLDSVKGVGPTTAIKLLKQYGSIEKIIESDKKINFPKEWDYEAARKLFKEPDATKGEEFDLVWKEADEEGVVDFLVKEKGFNEERVRNSIAKLRKAKSAATQGRLDSFFKPAVKADGGGAPEAVKRKAVDTKKVAAKKARTGGKPGRKPK